MDMLNKSAISIFKTIFDTCPQWQVSNLEDFKAIIGTPEYTAHMKLWAVASSPTQQFSSTADVASSRHTTTLSTFRRTTSRFTIRLIRSDSLYHHLL